MGRLDVRHLENDRVRPLAVVVQALCAHDRDLNAALGLAPFCLWNDFRAVLQHLVVLSQHAYHGALSRLHRPQSEGLPFTQSPGLPESLGMKRKKMVARKVVGHKMDAGQDAKTKILD